MWNRQEIKARGKDRFRINYWKCVLTALIFAVIGGGISNSSSGVSFSQNLGRISLNGGELTINGQEIGIGSREIAIAAIVFAAIFAVAFLVSFALNVFVLNPVYVGGKNFYLKNSEEMAGLGEIGYGFRNYWRVVRGMLLKSVFQMLWTLLFIVPGIIKAYSYRMVPYILIEEPELSAKEAITRSRQMMNGNKWRTFVFDLSFILWDLLSMITMGVVGVFYVDPYKHAADAELYKAIKAGGQA